MFTFPYFVCVGWPDHGLMHFQVDTITFLSVDWIYILGSELNRYFLSITMIFVDLFWSLVFLFNCYIAHFNIFF